MTFDDLDSLSSDPRVFWTEDVLRFRDTDANGHINNSIFAVLCESGRVSFFRARLTPHLPPDIFFVIARLTIDFRAELHYPGAVRTGTWVTRLGRSSITLRQAIVRDGRLAAGAEGVCVLMDRATRRSTPFSGAARQAAQEALRPPP